MTEELLNNYLDVLKENSKLKRFIDKLIEDNLDLTKKLMELEEVENE